MLQQEKNKEKERRNNQTKKQRFILQQRIHGDCLQLTIQVFWPHVQKLASLGYSELSFSYVDMHNYSSHFIQVYK